MAKDDEETFWWDQATVRLAILFKAIPQLHPQCG